MIYGYLLNSINESNIISRIGKILFEGKLESLKNKVYSLKAVAPKAPQQKNLKVSKSNDNKVHMFDLIDAKHNLYQSDATIAGCKVKLKLSWYQSIDPDCIQNINIVIKMADRSYENIYKIVFSHLTKWPQDAIQEDAVDIKCKDALLDIFTDDNGYYTFRVKLLLTSNIKDHERVIAGICVNSKSHQADIRYWDTWPLDNINESIVLSETASIEIAGKSDSKIMSKVKANFKKIRNNLLEDAQDKYPDSNLKISDIKICFIDFREADKGKVSYQVSINKEDGFYDCWINLKKSENELGYSDYTFND